ncbi:MAG: methyltransferase domain-containing protein [Bacteroidetes bacterium]|nr:methyltransferase domain-containing protein [Bacteroidota bacterium]
MVVLTTNWVWESPFYGFVIRFIDFYNVNDGNESIINNLKPKIDEGYSVLVFPEGSRSKDQNITRFHKGAFYLAKQLNLDIVPIIIHGAGDCMRKGENYVRSGKITLKIFDRISAPHVDFGNDYHELTKSLQTFYRTNYKLLKKDCETADYFADTLIKNYVFKGPILEWYCRIKVKLEDNYRYFNEIIPPKADIMDIGCGYGFMSYMLGFLSNERKIFGIDYDADKIEIAQNCISKNENVKFEYADATQYKFVNKDVFILSDILHYISEEKQNMLIENCINHLNNNGIIIIRDANKNLKTRHWGTRYTEFFSTKTGFNKLEGGKLHFTNVDAFINIANKFNLKYEVIDNTKLTSNILFIIQN